MLVGQNEESALWKLAWGCPPPALVQQLGGQNWGLSVGFVVTAGVIAWIWPLAGIAVKAVSTTELGSMLPTHSRAQMCVRTYTHAGLNAT